MPVLVPVPMCVRTRMRMRVCTSSQRQKREHDKEMEVRQRRATTAETNGAPGEFDRQEIFLNQDTSQKGAAVITISS